MTGRRATAASRPISPCNLGEIPDYYRRFGFSTDKARFLDSPFNPKSFMALELSPNALQGIRGKVRYPEAFGL